MAKETTTKVLEIDPELNKEFVEYCKGAGVRYPSKLAASLLENAMRKELKKAK